VRTSDGVAELRARGMPLGLMPGMEYEERSFQFQPGDCALLHSDGLAEAHGPGREMFGFPRVARLVGKGPAGEELIDRCLTELHTFTGPHYEQEDDITLVSLQRSPAAWVRSTGPLEASPVEADTAGASDEANEGGGAMTPVPRSAPGRPGRPRRLDAFALASEPGNERLAIARVAASAASAGLPAARLERLKTAVAEAVMNAIEHGNGNRTEIPVDIEVTRDGDEITVSISDQGGSPPTAGAEEPDLTKKLNGAQSPRGWGLFLIRSMVDAMEVTGDGDRHTVLLTMRTGAPEGADHDEQV
jgi:anti-sigma regulatory factor (Ser/Thr protein kinase)